MEVILPYNIKNRRDFCHSAIHLGFDEYVALKFVYTNQDSDLDVFQLMGNERLSLLLYGWEMCDEHLREAEDKVTYTAELLTVVKILTHYSLDMWFSKEWNQCKRQYRHALLHCLRRRKKSLEEIPELGLLNWDYLLGLGLQPWNVNSLMRFSGERIDIAADFSDSIETVEENASREDIEYLQQEGIFLVMLRLIKLFDQGAMEGVKQMSMRVLAAWNHVYCTYRKQADVPFPMVKEDHKRCLIVICHIYLMAVYETDSVRGYVIDNMMNNIRFYYQNIQDKTTKTDFNLEAQYTAAHFIALTCINLRISSTEFFEAFIFDTFDETCTTLFGATASAYLSYVLGNLLMEMNNMNEEDFAANLDRYKHLMNHYITTREKSEVFLLREIQKQEIQKLCGNTVNTVKNLTDFKNKICKGNRMSNISNFENSEDDYDAMAVAQLEEEKASEAAALSEETGDMKNVVHDHQVDPIFQNMPNNEMILNYVYDVLVKRSYSGWHFAKLVLLTKIIGHELNAIETWRYHPGLTTKFMLQLEHKLGEHFEHLAKNFSGVPILEQEFWLTAFYLNPTRDYHVQVKRCGLRNLRKRQHYDENQMLADNGTDKVVDCKNGLLSSTIDVHEIVKMSNLEAPQQDYEPLRAALRSLRLPENLIKDLLTITFSSRNRSFAWAVNWNELRARCKALVQNEGYKKRFVEQNMAEANNKLKFLNIDYDKYKNRPQLDYGSIEEGYENVVNLNEYDDDSDDDDDLDYEDYDKQNLKSIKTEKKWEIKDDSEEEDFSASSGENDTKRTRRTRAVRRKRRTEKLKEVNSGSNSPKATEVQIQPAQASSSFSKAVLDTEPVYDISNCASMEELLQKRTICQNDTSGFVPFSDIWNIDTHAMRTVNRCETTFFETKVILSKFDKLRNLKTQNDGTEMPNKTEEFPADSAILSDDDNVQSLNDQEQEFDVLFDETSNSKEGDNAAQNKCVKKVVVKQELQGETMEKVSSIEIKQEKLDKNEHVKTNAKMAMPNADSNEESSQSDASTTALKDIQEDHKYITTSSDGQYESDDIHLLADINKKRTISSAIDATSRDELKKPRLENAADKNKKASLEETLVPTNVVVKEEYEIMETQATSEHQTAATAAVTAEKSFSATISKNAMQVHAAQTTAVDKPTSLYKSFPSNSKICSTSSLSPLKYNKPLTISNTTNQRIEPQIKNEPIEDFESEQFESNKSAHNLCERYSPKDDCFQSDNSNSSGLNSESEGILKTQFKRTVVVNLRRLTISDLEKAALRQPTVRLKRMNMDAFFEEQQQRKRARLAQKALHDAEDTNSLSSSSGTSFLSTRIKRNAGRPRKYQNFVETSEVLARRGITSDSSVDSDEEMRQIGSRFVGGRGRPRKAIRGGRIKDLMVTPRSASGLKLRISSRDPDTVSDVCDIIQISSSSSSSHLTDEPGPSRLIRVVHKSLSPVAENVEQKSVFILDEDELDDPLFEEEMLIGN